MKLVRSLAFLSALLPAVAQAEPFVFVGLGTAWAKAAGASQDGSAFELGAGYKFGRFFAAEVSFHDSSGRSDASVAGTVSTLRFWDSSGFGASAVGYLPLSGSFSILAKLGAHRLENDTRVLVSDISQPVSTTVADVTTTSKKLAPSLAVGAQYSVTDEVHVRALFRHFKPGGELDRIHVLSVEVARSF